MLSDEMINQILLDVANERSGEPATNEWSRGYQDCWDKFSRRLGEQRVGGSNDAMFLSSVMVDDRRVMDRRTVEDQIKDGAATLKANGLKGPYPLQSHYHPAGTMVNEDGSLILPDEPHPTLRRH